MNEGPVFLWVWENANDNVTDVLVGFCKQFFSVFSGNSAAHGIVYVGTGNVELLSVLKLF